jgi:hypothetical protein
MLAYLETLQHSLSFDIQLAWRLLIEYSNRISVMKGVANNEPAYCILLPLRTDTDITQCTSNSEADIN